MTLTTDVINNLLNVKESYQASDALMKMLFDKKASAISVNLIKESR
ncbi:hypothetical protein ACSZUX_002402 [Listeria monocytogenes]|nr:MULTISPECIES: hypothetical protein [Listeria]